jgi:hypothetical protein
MVRRTLAQLTLARPILTRLTLARLTLARLTLVRFRLARLTLAQLTLAHLQLAPTRLTLARLTMSPLTFAQLTPNLRLGIALMTLQVARKVSVSVLAIVTPKIDVVTTHVAIFTFTVKIVVIIDVNIPAICFETNIAIIVAVAALVSVAPASRTSATTKILVNIDYATTADIATDIHHSCSGFFDDAIIDNVLNTAPELIDTDATALVEASSTSVGSTVRAYTAQLTMGYITSTDSDSATFLNKTAAVHDAAAVLQYEAVLTVYDSVVAAATTVTSTSTTIVVAAVENVATAILVNIDSATATKIATGIHHGCSGFPDNVIVNNILIAAPPDLVDTDATAPVIMAGITSAGSTARPAYTTRLTIDRLSSTGSGSATVAAATTTATTATSASTTAAAVAAVDNAAISEFGIDADPFAVAVDVSSWAPKYSK